MEDEGFKSLTMTIDGAIGKLWCPMRGESSLTHPKNIGNVLGANQSLRANYENFNLSHLINIQGVCEIG